jgi:hypothetical protein
MREGRIKKKNGDDAVREVIEDQHLPTPFFFFSFHFSLFMAVI